MTGGIQVPQEVRGAAHPYSGLAGTRTRPVTERGGRAHKARPGHHAARARHGDLYAAEDALKEKNHTVHSFETSSSGRPGGRPWCLPGATCTTPRVREPRG